MDENRLRFGVGVLVISAIGIGIILVFLFGAFPSVLQREYALTVVFPSAEGIAANSAVVRDGVRIGRVESIDLRDEGGVLVTLSMDATKTLTHRYVPRISAGNLVTGDAQLEFVRANDPMLAEIFGADREIVARPYSDGEYLRYGTKSDSLLEMQNDLQDTFSAIRTAGESISTAAESVEQLSQGVRQTVQTTDGKITDLSDRATQALDTFEGAMSDFQSIVGDPKLQADIKQTLDRFPVVLDEAQSALTTARETFDTFDQVGVQFEKVGVAAEGRLNELKSTVQRADKTIENIEQFTEPLAERGEELVTQVLDTLTQLESALAQAETFGRTLNNSDGTVKRLIEDDDIYWQIRRTVENIEQSTARLRPILDDVRIFSDKIARDPRQLGVRGALNKRPSGTGLK